jgi:anti-anti-sigma regulatory factor
MTLGAIVQTYVSAVRVGGTVKLTNVSKRFRELLTVTKLDRIMEIVDVRRRRRSRHGRR